MLGNPLHSRKGEAKPGGGILGKLKPSRAQISVINMELLELEKSTITNFLFIDSFSLLPAAGPQPHTVTLNDQLMDAHTFTTSTGHTVSRHYRSITGLIRFSYYYQVPF